MIKRLGFLKMHRSILVDHRIISTSHLNKLNHNNILIHITLKNKRNKKVIKMTIREETISHLIKSSQISLSNIGL